MLLYVFQYTNILYKFESDEGKYIYQGDTTLRLCDM